MVRLRARRRDRAPKIAVCAVIENGGHGGTAAAPAALKVFEQFFHTKTPAAIGDDPLRLAMADLRLHPHRAVSRQGAPPRTHPGGVAPRPARLGDARHGPRARRASGSGRSPASRGTTWSAAPTTTSTASSCSSPSALVGLVAAILIDPESTAGSRSSIYVGTLAPVRVRVPRRAPSPAARSAGSTSASSASSRPSSGSCSSSSPSPASSPTGSGAIGEWRTSLTAIALALPPMLLVFIQPDIGSALVYVAALVGVLLRRRRPLAPPRVLAIVAVVLALSVLWWLPVGRHAGAEGVPDGPSDRLPPSRPGPAAARPTT